MNNKRNGSEYNENLPKKAKFSDEQWTDGCTRQVSSPFKIEHDVQSHGEPTVAAITDFGSDSDSELNELGIDCFDEFVATDAQNRQPVAGPMGWIQLQIEQGADPRYILEELLPPNIVLPGDMDTFMMWKLIFDLLADIQPRQKLQDINTLDQVLHLLKTSKNILVLTGAGVSVSCGIPDFRSRDGIYARLSKEYPDLPDPQAMFDISYFRQNTKPFYKFAKEIYPGKFKPSLSHRFIHQLEKNNQLLHNYTQNIDTLEREAGITRVVECHGSFSTASCTNCKHKVQCHDIQEDILNQVTPHCPKCPLSEGVLSVMKPDIVFFGESLPQKFHNCIEKDVAQVDLLIVIGSSLKVRPVNLIPNQIPDNVPQILINREPLPHVNFDVELLGDCDTIIGHMCKELGEPWNGVLQGFEIPNVSNEFVTPFLQTPPASPKEDIKENVMDERISLDQDSCCLENKSLQKNRDVKYIFLPPCRYIFHGAEVGHCDSPIPFEDASVGSSTAVSLSESSDEIDDIIAKQHPFEDQSEP